MTRADWLILGTILLFAAFVSMAGATSTSGITWQYNAIANTLTIVENSVISNTLPYSGNVQINFTTLTISNVIFVNTTNTVITNNSVISSHSTFMAPANNFKQVNQHLNLTYSQCTSNTIFNYTFCAPHSNLPVHANVVVTNGQNVININNVTITPPNSVNMTLHFVPRNTVQNVTENPIANVMFGVIINATPNTIRNFNTNALTVNLPYGGNYVTNSTCLQEICNVIVNGASKPTLKITGNYVGYNKTATLGFNSIVSVNESGPTIQMLNGNTVLNTTILPGIFLHLTVPSYNAALLNDTTIGQIFGALAQRGCVPGQLISFPDATINQNTTLCTRYKGSNVTLFDLGISVALSTNTPLIGLGQLWISSYVGANTSARTWRIAYNNQVNTTTKQENKTLTQNRTLWGRPIPANVFYGTYTSGSYDINDIILALNLSQSQNKAKSAGAQGGIIVAVIVILILTGAFVAWTLMNYSSRKKRRIQIPGS